MKKMISVVLMVLFSIGSSGSSYSAEDVDRQKLYNEADLVFVGKLTKSYCCDTGIHSTDSRYKNMSLAVIDIPIKGLSHGGVIFNHQFGIIDAQPADCCEVGATYLFYLQAAKGEDWYNATGQAAMIKISGKKN